MTDEPTNRETHEEAALLRALFRPFNEPIADADFTGATLGRIKSPARWRRLVLCSAVTVGAVFAAIPVIEYADSISDALVSVSMHWQDTSWLVSHWVPVFGVAAMAAWGAALGGAAR